jgi:hypothetical protein
MRGEHNPVKSAYDFNGAFLRNRCDININIFLRGRIMKRFILCIAAAVLALAAATDAATWVSGSNARDQSGVYGTKGVAASGNVPGARGGRGGSVSWIDGHGNLWLFGGYGLDASGNSGYLNDLWKFDGNNWTWVSGSNSVNQSGVYGTQGVAASGNVPGARDSSVSWIDGYGNLWLSGGGGYDASGSYGYLNDLWKFDGTNWTWVSGSNSVNQNGVYGTKGIAASGNVPGARDGSVSWIDGYGNLWLFGGYGPLNDLWKFDGTNWTWVSGSNSVNQNGVYGTKGVAASDNVPGARYCSVSWIDGYGNLWLFGGYGLDASGNWGYLNDLWKFVYSNPAANADLNGDGFVNFYDFALLASHWLNEP